jgi:hypothetical protein
MVERQDVDDLINTLYRRLFYLPRTALLSFVYVIEGLVISLLNMGSLKGLPFAAIPTLAGLVIYFALIYVTFVTGAAVDTIKKALGIAVFSIAPYIFVDLVGSLRERHFLSFASSSGMVFLI